MFIFGLILMLIAILVIVSEWIIFTKAGKPGWAIFIPIYNIIVYLQIIRTPWWWIFLLCIPIANIVFAIIILNRLSIAFGKGSGFTVGLIFLSFIFLPILAFGDAKYVLEAK